MSKVQKKYLVAVLLAALLLFVFTFCMYAFASENKSNYVIDSSAKTCNVSDSTSTQFSDGSLYKNDDFSVDTLNLDSTSVENGSGMSATYTMYTYVDPVTGTISIPKKISLINYEEEYQIKFRGISLKTQSGYEKMDGNWQLTLDDGTTLFYGEIGDSITFDTPIVMEPSSKILLNASWDRSGIFEKRYFNKSPFIFNFSYTVSKPTPYANYYESEEDNTITFYYDDEYSTRAGKNYTMPTSSTARRGWIADNYKNVTKIIVDQTYNQYAPENFNYWFGIDANDGEISNLKYIDVTYLNTSNCKYFNYTFGMCTNVETIIGLEKWDTSKGEYFNNIFWHNNVEKLNISDWDMSSAKVMEYMFADTTGAKLPDLSKWNMSNVANMYMMFAYSSVEDFSGVYNWDVSNLSDANFMFANCYKAQVAPNLGSWTTPALDSCYYMFYNFGNNNGGVLFSIYLNNWTWASVSKCYRMFYGCIYLQAIYCNVNLQSSCSLLTQTTTANMFYKCENLNPLLLVSGTPTDWTYAYPKTEEDPNGFFTAC